MLFCGLRCDFNDSCFLGLFNDLMPSTTRGRCLYPPPAVTVTSTPTKNHIILMKVEFLINLAQIGRANCATIRCRHSPQHRLHRTSYLAGAAREGPSPNKRVVQSL